MTGLPCFRTDRLLVRPLVAGDLDGLYCLIYADPVVRAHFGSATTPEEVRALHMAKVRANSAAASGGFGYWGIVLQPGAAVGGEGGTLIGQVLLGPPERMPWITLAPDSAAQPLGREVELGYALGRAYWGRGYAREACVAVVRYAFAVLGLRRLVNSVRRANEASIALMRRLGFRIEDNLADPDAVVGILDGDVWMGLSE